MHRAQHQGYDDQSEGGEDDHRAEVGREVDDAVIPAHTAEEGVGEEAVLEDIGGNFFGIFLELQKKLFFLSG